MLHPPGIGGRPDHGLEPVEGLQSKTNDEAQAEPRVHFAAERPSAEERREPAEEPGEIDTEAGEERQEEKERDHPVEHARVRGMAQQLSAIDGRSAVSETRAGLVAEPLDGAARHWYW